MKVNLNLKKVFKHIKQALKKAPGFLARQSFLFFLFLCVLCSIFSAFIFYKYSFPVPKTGQDFLGSLVIKENLVKLILEKIDVEEARFEEIDTKDYPNIFMSEKTEETETLIE